jgi:hypothetical protein
VELLSEMYRQRNREKVDSKRLARRHMARWLYDNMLDTAVMLGAIPARFRGIADEYERYFAMARGTETAAAMSMMKWFNTNYHFIVPELSDKQPFKLDASKILAEYAEAKALGINGKINVTGEQRQKMADLRRRKNRRSGVSGRSGARCAGARRT